MTAGHAAVRALRPPGEVRIGARRHELSGDEGVARRCQLQCREAVERHPVRVGAVFEQRGDGVDIADQDRHDERRDRGAGGRVVGGDGGQAVAAQRREDDRQGLLAGSAVTQVLRDGRRRRHRGTGGYGVEHAPRRHPSRRAAS
ncbi:MAG: hypothetical protein R2699_03045 [Acidimicrobiales bacterium]